MTGVPERFVELRNGLTIGLSAHPDDVLTVFVVFAREDYGPIPLGSTVVDVGANTGILSLYAISKGAAHVFAYEPNNESFAHLEHNIQRNGLTSRIHPQRVAVTGAGEGSVKFPVGSSAYNAILPADAEGAFEWVPTTSLERIVRDNQLERVDLLKLDCEGAEYEIISQAPAEIWERVDTVRLEYHQGRPEYFVALLGRQGFTVERHRRDTERTGMLWFRATRAAPSAGVRADAVRRKAV
jgi:FkbM family methyltransferase